MFAKLIIICVLAIATSQAYPGRIFGAHEAPLVGFEHQVSIQRGFENDHDHICGASVLNSRWIVTSADCLIDYLQVPPYPGVDLYAVAGIHFIKEEGQTSKLKRIILHPDYNKGYAQSNDIAVIELENELILNDKVKAVQLPEKNAIFSGNLTLSGWGSKGGAWPGNLQTLDLPIISNEECTDAFTKILGSYAPSVSSTMVCTGQNIVNHQGGCAGDGGSPLVLRQGNNVVLVGILSWGLMFCGTYGAPTVYTQVSSFLDFINEHVK